MNKFKARLVYDTLTSLLMHPVVFFSRHFEGISTPQSAGILVLSSLFFAASGTLINPGDAAFRMGIILFINAVGMATIGAGISFLATAVPGSRRCPFSRLWNLFSLCSGVVLLIAWVPGAFLLTEPWKWWLIATGLINGLGMTKVKAVIVVLFTFGVMVTMIYAILPFVQFAAAHRM